jgi:hypothetical protein
MSQCCVKEHILRGAVTDSRYITFQTAEVAIIKEVFVGILLEQVKFVCFGQFWFSNGH